jgi:hypothetical protein
LRTGDTWTERPLISGLAYGPAHAAWLDAERFVFVRWDAMPQTSTTGAQALLGHVDGTIERVLGDGAIEPWATACLSPDGSAAAYPVISAIDSQGGPAAFELVILPTDGRRAVRIPIDHLGSADVAPCSWRASSRPPPGQSAGA